MRNRIRHPELRQAAERAALLMDAGDYQSAISVWTQFIVTDPFCATAHFERGQLRAAAGIDAIGMLEDFKAATDLDPSDPHFRFVFNLTFGGSLQSAYIEDQEQALLDEAIRRFDCAIESSPFEAAAYNYRGTAHLMRSDAEQAFSDFSVAIELDGDDGYAYLMRGMLAFDNGCLAMAKEDLESALDHRETLSSDYQELLDSRYADVVAELVGS